MHLNRLKSVLRLFLLDADEASVNSDSDRKSERYGETKQKKNVAIGAELFNNNATHLRCLYQEENICL